MSQGGTKQIPVNQQVRKRCCGWTEHTLRKSVYIITIKPFHWSQQSKRNRGRPENAWRREIETGMCNMERELQEIATDRTRKACLELVEA